MTQVTLTDVCLRLDDIEKKLHSPLPPPREFLSVEQAATYVGLSKVSLDEWRCKGGGPAYHKVGRRVLYSVGDLRTFMASLRKEALV